MNEYLVIRLGARAQEAVHWLVWSPQEREIIASGILANAGELAQLAERAGGRPIQVLVPGSEVIFRQVTLPGRVTRQALKGLPFLLEDEVAGDVEQLHLVVLSRQGQQLELMAVEQAKLELWLDWLAAAGLSARNLLPDVLALPLPEAGWSAVRLGEQWLIRQSEHKGMVAEGGWLAGLLASLPEQPRIHCFGTPPEGVAGEWVPEPAELAMQLLAQGAQQPRFSLLQGRYRPQAEWSRLWRPWRKVAIAAGILLLTLGLNKGGELYQLTAENARLKAETESLYRQLVPGARRVINPRVQLTQQLRALEGGSRSESLLRLLQQLQPLLAQVPDFQTQTLRYDGAKGELRLQLFADGFQSFDRFRSLAETRFDVSPADIKSQGKGVVGTLVLRSKS